MAITASEFYTSQSTLPKPNEHSQHSSSKEGCDKGTTTNINNIIEEIDVQYKALTARTPETIEKEISIDINEVFPEDATTLYIGDPWQKMGTILDRDNMHIIDYEFGETASFMRSVDDFVDNIWENLFDSRTLGIPGLNNSLRNLLLSHDYTEKEQEWFNQFRSLFHRAYITSSKATRDYSDQHNAENTKDLWRLWPEAAEAWQSILDFLNTSYKQELDNGETPSDNWSYTNFKKSAFYTASTAIRGFLDIPDWETIIEPRRVQYKTQLQELNYSEERIKQRLDQMTRQLIHHLRFEQKTEHAHVSQAMFPDLPQFADNKFDRVVASWSISAHLFDELDFDQFKLCWKEIARLLDDKGRAYIFPLDWQNSYDHIALIQSLDAVCDSHGLTYYFKDVNGNIQIPESYDLGHTLIIEKIPVALTEQ